MVIITVISVAILVLTSIMAYQSNVNKEILKTIDSLIDKTEDIISGSRHDLSVCRVATEYEIKKMAATLEQQCSAKVDQIESRIGDIESSMK